MSDNVHECCLEGRLKDVERLVNTDPDVVKSHDEDRRLPVHWAASGGHLAIVQFLIDHHSPVDEADEAGWTPLHIAVSAGHTPIAEYLINKGANINSQTENGQTPLHYAASKNRDECLALLFEHNADLTVADKQRQSAFVRAVAVGHLPLLQRFIAHLKEKKTLDQVLCGSDTEGNTPLHRACEENRADVALLLIEHGARTNVQNKAKKAPFDLATAQVRKYLEAHV